MMPGFHIRVTETHEIPLVKRVRRIVFTEEQGIPATLDDDGLDTESLHALIVETHTNEIMACGRLYSESNKKAILARIGVLEKARGVGFGKMIVKFLEEQAIKKGIQEIELHPHKHLFDFYQRLGYSLSDNKEFIVAGHTLLTMTKKIG